MVFSSEIIHAKFLRNMLKTPWLKEKLEKTFNKQFKMQSRNKI